MKRNLFKTGYKVEDFEVWMTMEQFVAKANEMLESLKNESRVVYGDGGDEWYDTESDEDYSHDAWLVCEERMDRGDGDDDGYEGYEEVEDDE